MSDLLTVKDVATILRCSEDAVVKRFAKVDGVIDLGKSTLGVRRYRVLRIPKAVVEKYLTSKSGRSVTVTVPERAERRRKSPKWEDRAILNIAKAALQNEFNLDVNPSAPLLGMVSRLAEQKGLDLNARKFF